MLTSCRLRCLQPELRSLFSWPAFAQYLDEAGVDWRSFQNSYDWATNSGLFYFQAFQQADKNSSLYKRGLAFDGDNSLASFRAAAAAGTSRGQLGLPPPVRCRSIPQFAQRWCLVRLNQIVDAAIHGKNYNETVVIVTYDGTYCRTRPLIVPEAFQVRL